MTDPNDQIDEEEEGPPLTKIQTSLYNALEKFMEKDRKAASFFYKKVLESNWVS